MTAVEMAPAPLYGELALHRVLVAIDGSANADLALTAAITAARRDHATLTLILVGPDVMAGPAAWSVPIAAGTDQGAVDADGCRRLQATVARIPADVPVSTMYRRGQGRAGDHQGGQGGRLRRDRPRRARRRPGARADGQREPVRAQPRRDRRVRRTRA